mgnify:FL=1
MENENKKELLPVSKMRDEDQNEYFLASLLDPKQQGNVKYMQKFDQLMMMYNCAIREIRTKLEVLNDDLGARYERNPIEHINARIKSPESIAKKLKNKNLPICSDSIPNNLNDVAGIRVICSFIDDIYTIAGMLIRQDDVRLVKMKDYIEHPKPNGYRSLHLILEVPVFFADVTRPMRVEVQIRTIAMDFWASLDHHLRYKKDVKDAQEIENELRRCADVISQTDEDMLKIRKRIFSDEAARSENHSFW